VTNATIVIAVIITSLRNRGTTDISWVHGGTGVSCAGEDEADSGDGEHPRLDNGVARAFEDDPE
jgi:hypothetical protein